MAVKRINISLDESIFNQLEEQVKRYGSNRSTLIAHYLMKGIEQDRAMAFLSQIPQDQIPAILEQYGKQ